MLHNLLALAALLIAIWIACKFSKDMKSPMFLTGIAIGLLAICHLVKIDAKGSFVFMKYYNVPTLNKFHLSKMKYKVFTYPKNK